MTSRTLRARCALPLLLLAFNLCSQTALARSSSTHVVRRGQTLWSIAHAYGVKVDEIMDLNGIRDPTTVPIGLELRLPGNTREAKSSVRAGKAPRFTWPLRGVLTSRYGRRRGRTHAGLDIAAAQGTIVVASAPGRALRAGGRWGRYGIVVLIEHGDGHKTLYAHLSRAFVRPGARVRRGQAIAAVGRTGNATGPHLHFEIWRGDRTVDPLRELPP